MNDNKPKPGIISKLRSIKPWEPARWPDLAATLWRLANHQASAPVLAFLLITLVVSALTLPKVYIPTARCLGLPILIWPPSLLRLTAVANIANTWWGKVVFMLLLIQSTAVTSKLAAQAFSPSGNVQIEAAEIISNRRVFYSDLPTAKVQKRLRLTLAFIGYRAQKTSNADIVTCSTIQNVSLLRFITSLCQVTLCLFFLLWPSVSWVEGQYLTPGDRIKPILGGDLFANAASSLGTYETSTGRKYTLPNPGAFPKQAGGLVFVWHESGPALLLKAEKAGGQFALTFMRGETKKYLALPNHGPTLSLTLIGNSHSPQYRLEYTNVQNQSQSVSYDITSSSPIQIGGLTMVASPQHYQFYSLWLAPLFLPCHILLVVAVVSLLFSLLFSGQSLRFSYSQRTEATIIEMEQISQEHRLPLWRLALRLALGK